MIEQLFKDMVNAMNDDVIETISRIVWGWSNDRFQKIHPYTNNSSKFSHIKIENTFWLAWRSSIESFKYARNVSIMDFTWL
jgi:hypothetical protein